MRASGQAFERFTKEFIGREFFPRVGVGERFDGFECVHLFVSEGDQGKNGVVHFVFPGIWCVLIGGGFPSGGDADFIFQFENDAFGGFFADAFDLGEGFDVTGDDSGFEAGN